MALTIQTVTNPVYSSANNSSIDCMVKFAEYNAAIPVTVVDGDLPHIQLLWDNLTANTYGTIQAYATPTTPVPSVISDRQFAQVLAMTGFITQNEAKAWVKTGEIPAALQAVVDLIEDPDDKFAAEMLLSGAVEFYRDHSLVEVVRLQRGMTSAEVDDIFRLAATL